MRNEERVRKALHSLLITQFLSSSLLSFLGSCRQTLVFPPLRVCWLLIPCAFSLLSCSPGRPPTPTAPKPTVGTHHLVRPGETLAAIGRVRSQLEDLAQVTRSSPHTDRGRQAILIPSQPGMHGSRVPVLSVPSLFVPDRHLQWPTDGVLSSGFGMRGGRFHAGIDISGERGTPIVAVDEGVVMYSGRGPDGYGNVVMLDHGSGLITLYAHNERNVVRRENGCDGDKRWR